MRFDSLATEGNIIAPLAPGFFSPGFGVLTDKFGVSWIITIATPCEYNGWDILIKNKQ